MLPVTSSKVPLTFYLELFGAWLPMRRCCKTDNKHFPFPSPVPISSSASANDPSSPSECILPLPPRIENHAGHRSAAFRLRNVATQRAARLFPASSPLRRFCSLKTALRCPVVVQDAPPPSQSLTAKLTSADASPT